ncbi:MAG: M50 family metallopeptidase [Candidatus Pacebacteria bacterium]|jgi:regulator of sigma E protease|nr:M50 family metallopeptidase [Candidatus Paceibacterota bacterium]MDD5535269.1 M50 family metallopeptidase [Candidatus Paceibacterota bacterium]
MIYFIISLLCLGVIIFLHELGHFLMARKHGVTVEEFGIGYPPRLFSFKKNGVVYSINAIPFGGFVKIVEFGDKNSFAAQSLGKRASILVAGVVSNFIIAFLIFTILFSIGMPTFALPQNYQEEVVSNIKIQKIEEESPAFSAGLELGDIILGIKYLNDYYLVSSVQDVQEKTAELEGKKIQLVIERKGDQVEIEVLLRPESEAAKGYLGVVLNEEGYLQYSVIEAPRQSFILMGTLTKEMLTGLGRVFINLFKGDGSIEELTGPVGIMAITTRSFQWGWDYGFYILGIISYAFAIFNLLPIPAVDGGRIFFLGIEKIRRRPIAQKTELIINNICFSLLVILLFVVTIKDINLFILNN